MSFLKHPNLAEALRLTRDGRLGEATTLLQRMLKGTEDETPAPADTAGAGRPGAERARESGPAEGVRPGPKRRSGLGETLRRMAAAEAAPRPAGRALPPIPEGARFETFPHATAGGSREYKLYLPAAMPHGRLPLVVMLHGCTQSPDDFAAGTRMNRLAEAHGVLVAYPAQATGANAQRCWNWFLPENQRRGGEPALIAGIVAAIAAAHPVDNARIYAAGMSAGGAAAAVLGAAYPELFAAVGVHSGLPVGAASDVRSAYAAMRRAPAVPSGGAGVPTIVFHGDADATVDPENAAEVAAQAAGGARIEHERGTAGGRTYTRAVHRDRAGRVVAERWTVHGGGHTWSGGDPAGSYADPQGPDASAEMLRFFLAQRR